MTSSTTPSIGTISTSGLVRTFTLTIPANNTDQAVISGIPYGTQYRVEEQNVTNYTNVSDGNIGTSSTLNISGTHDYVVENKHDVYNLTLQKSVTGDAMEDVLGSDYATDTFNYVVTLTSAENVDLRDYLSDTYFTGAVADGGLGLASTSVVYHGVSEVSGTENEHKTQYVLTIPVSQNVSKTIGGTYGGKTYGIPAGTSYRVDESYSYTDGNGITHTSSVDNTHDSASGKMNSAKTVKYVNDFTRANTGTINLKKKPTTVKTGGSTANAGENQSFTYTVVLNNNSVTWSSYSSNISVASPGSKSEPNSPYSYNDHTYTFYVTVPATGNEVAITGIPDGTTYSISEVADSDYTLKSLDGNTTTLSVTDASIVILSSTSASREH